MFLAFGASSLFAQSQQSPAYAQKAEISADMKITLPEAEVLPYQYEVSIESLKFENYAAARGFFRSISDNLVMYEVSQDASTVLLRPQYAHLGDEEWSLNEWQQYIDKLQTRYQKYYSSASASK